MHIPQKLCIQEDSNYWGFFPNKEVVIWMSDFAKVAEQIGIKFNRQTLKPVSV